MPRKIREDERQGSRMSTRQMARAATSGRLLTFRFQDSEIVEGYLVGSDDFHWLVAHQPDEKPRISLIHKGSTYRIDISPDPELDNENDALKAFVVRIGRGFWLFCDQTYLGKTDPANTIQEQAS